MFISICAEEPYELVSSGDLRVLIFKPFVFIGFADVVEEIHGK